MQRYLLYILYTHWSVKHYLKPCYMEGKNYIMNTEYVYVDVDENILCITSCSKLAIFILVQSFNFCSRKWSWFSFWSMSMFFKCISVAGLTNSRGSMPDDTFWVNSVSFWIAWLHVCPGGASLRIRSTQELPQHIHKQVPKIL